MEIITKVKNQLSGGYKAWRRHVITLIDALAPQLHLRVLCGPTGSAKTRVLQALAEQRAQTLDLEGLARHRGSVLGAWPGVAQPSQTAFETALADAIEAFDETQPVYVEAESSRIGKISVPPPAWRLWSAPRRGLIFCCATTPTSATTRSYWRSSCITCGNCMAARSLRAGKPGRVNATWLHCLVN